MGIELTLDSSCSVLFGSGSELRAGKNLGSFGSVRFDENYGSSSVSSVRVRVRFDSHLYCGGNIKPGALAASITTDKQSPFPFPFPFSHPLAIPLLSFLSVLLHNSATKSYRECRRRSWRASRPRPT